MKTNLPPRKASTSPRPAKKPAPVGHEARLQGSAAKSPSLGIKLKTPVWSVVRQREQQSVSDACALSLNLRPNQTTKLSATTKPSKSAYATRLKTFRLALQQPNGIPVLDHIAAGERPEAKIVRLRDVVAFCIRKAIPIPDSLGKLGTQETAVGLDQRSPTVSVDPPVLQDRKTNAQEVENPAVESPRAVETIAQVENGDPFAKLPWLAIALEAHRHFFGDNRQHDPKSIEVVEWIKATATAKDAHPPCSKHLASVVFTLIKPSDHNPRKRTANP